MTEEFDPKKRIPFVLTSEDLEKIKKQFRELGTNSRKLEELFKIKNKKNTEETEETE